MDNGIKTCLSGSVVLDLGQLHPGPHTAMLLGQLGATVIKVERKGEGDTARSLGRDTFAKYNRGKLSIALDLKDPEDKEILLRLVAGSDALIEGFRPGVMDRLGLGYADLNAVNPKLVMCSISGFGQEGPYAHRAGHDLNFLALAGYWAVPSQVEHVVSRPHVRLSDYCGSMYATLAMIVAMMTARESGKGQHLDVSLHDAMMAWTLPGIDIMLRKTGMEIDRMGHVMPDNDIFPTADGRFLVLGILEEKFWIALRDKLKAEFPDILAEAFSTRAYRMSNKCQLNALLKQIIAGKALHEWKDYFADADIPWSPVLDYDEILDDPHVKARRIFSREAEGEPITVGFPVRFSSGLPAERTSLPELDADREHILEWLNTGMPRK